MAEPIRCADCVYFRRRSADGGNCHFMPPTAIVRLMPPIIAGGQPQVAVGVCRPAVENDYEGCAQFQSAPRPEPGPVTVQG